MGENNLPLIYRYIGGNRCPIVRGSDISELKIGGSMKKLITLALALVALSGCDIDGRLSVSQPLNLVTKEKKTVVLQPGSYKADVEAEDNKLRLEIKVNGKEKKINFRTPNGQDLPKRNGTVFIPAATSGQSFDLSGEVNTDVAVSGRMRGVESCTTYDRVYVCRDVYVGSDRYGRPIYRRVCDYEVAPVPGHMEVEYHVETTTTDVYMAFLTPGTQTALATFEGSRSQSQTIYDYKGYCYRY